MKSHKPIELDGRTGEGGGQLVRIAVALASVCTIPVRITNVRGNRPGARGGGLKSQHVTSIEWLAKATDAEVKGLDIGSKTLEFRPARGPGALAERIINIRAESPAASALLIFQAVFPFLLFAGQEDGEPVELTISGGTNVSFSPSYEYVDQVLLPALEAQFGIRVERRLEGRGWSSGGATRGQIWFKIWPLALGSTLSLKEDLSLGKRNEDFEVMDIEVTIIAAGNMQYDLQNALREYLDILFPRAHTKFRETEESQHESRTYVLLVARSETLRWGQDILYSGKRKSHSKTELSKKVAKGVAEALRKEIQERNVVDAYLQDQLVIFQALSKGKTTFKRHMHRQQGPDRDEQSVDGIESGMDELRIEEQLRKDKVRGPLGDLETDSLHTRTARWVTSEMLEPAVKWYYQGSICEGASFATGSDGCGS